MSNAASEIDLPFLSCHLRGIRSLATMSDDELRSICEQGFRAVTQELASVKDRETLFGQCVVKLGDVKTKFPRIRQVSPPRKQTKWEKFAKQKGIADKTKRDKLVYVEEDEKWHPRFGYKGANKIRQKASDYIVELPDHGKIPNIEEAFASPKEKSQARRRSAKDAKLEKARCISSDAPKDVKSLSDVLTTSKKGDASLGKFSHEAQSQLRLLRLDGPGSFIEMSAAGRVNGKKQKPQLTRKSKRNRRMDHLTAKRNRRDKLLQKRNRTGKPQKRNKSDKTQVRKTSRKHKK